MFEGRVCLTEEGRKCWKSFKMVRDGELVVIDHILAFMNHIAEATSINMIYNSCGWPWAATGLVAVSCT